MTEPALEPQSPSIRLGTGDERPAEEGWDRPLGVFEAMTTSAARVWPPAGSWIMRALRGGGGSDPYWHIFTGDATWRVHWPGPALETPCGFVVGPLWGVDELRFEEREPEASCPRCLSTRIRAQRPSDGWEDASLA